MSSALLVFVLGSVFFSTGLQAFANYDPGWTDYSSVLTVSDVPSSYVISNYEPEQITIDGVARTKRNFAVTFGFTDTFNSYTTVDYYFGGYQITYIPQLQIGYNSSGIYVYSIGIKDIINTNDNVYVNVPAPTYRTDGTIDLWDISIKKLFKGERPKAQENYRVTIIYEIIYVAPSQLYQVGVKNLTVNYPWKLCLGSISPVLNLTEIRNILEDQYSIDLDMYYDLLDLKADMNYDLGEILNAISNINVNLLTDNSGVSENVNSAASSAAAAESAADTAISSALPSADAQLDSIVAYDYNSIHTDNATAFSFWKSVGDYILSNSNLRGIGALLILCLFLGFVVFLLRL